MLTGFVRTVRVYGEKAVERQSLRKVEAMLEQMTLPFRESDAPLADLEPAPSSVSFSGKDFAVISDIGKALRRKAGPALAAAE